MTEVQGLAAFEARLERIPDRVREAVRYAMQDIADRIVEDMFNVAPQGETLRLAGSIAWTWGDAPKGSMTLGTFGGGRQYATMRITIYAGGSEAFYARFQEFGTAKMAANPFFYPVWRARRRWARGKITRAINKALKES